MKLYDFSAYAKKREIQLKADDIEALKTRMDEPGIVAILKQQIEDYLTLHKDVLTRAQ